MFVNLQAQEVGGVNKTRHVLTPLRRRFLSRIGHAGIKQLFGWSGDDRLSSDLNGDPSGDVDGHLDGEVQVPKL